MKRYLYNYQTVVEFSEPVPAHAVMLRCQPVGNACQTVEQEHLVMSPNYWLQAGSDTFYNRILFGGTTEPHTVFAYVSMGIVANRHLSGQVSRREPAPLPSAHTIYYNWRRDYGY